MTSRNVHRGIYFFRRQSRQHRFERHMADFVLQWSDRRTAKWYSAGLRNYLLAGRPGLCPWQRSRSDLRTTDRFETCRCQGRGRTVQWLLVCGLMCMTPSAARCSVSAVHIHNIHKYTRVATNLENLEYSGISLNMEYSGNSVQTQGKIVTNKVFFSSSVKYLCKTDVDWVNRITRISGSSEPAQ